MGILLGEKEVRSLVDGDGCRCRFHVPTYLVTTNTTSPTKFKQVLNFVLVGRYSYRHRYFLVVGVFTTITI